MFVYCLLSYLANIFECLLYARHCSKSWKYTRNKKGMVSAFVGDTHPY